MKRCISVPNFPGKIFSGKWHQSKYFTGEEIRRGNRTDVVATNMGIWEYVKLGRLDIARNLFDEMSHRTVVTWNTILSGYSKWGKYREALDLIRNMHFDGIRFTDTTFSCALSACANSQSFDHGQQIHGLTMKSGSESFDFVGTALLNFYAKCFRIIDASRVFNELHQKNKLLWNVMLVGYVKCNLMDEALKLFWSMPKRDVIAWTCMISGYAKIEYECRKALDLFIMMRESEEVTPNEFSFDSVIRACAMIGDLQKGRIVHTILLKSGFESDDLIAAALIEFYCKCEAINDAKSVYRVMDKPSMNTSNAFLNNLITKERFDDAEKVFNELDEVNTLSFNLMIKGYALEGRIEDSIRVFEKMPCKSIISSNTMISAYFRNGEIEKAVKLFREIMEERNPDTWNSVISGFTQNKMYEESLRVFMEMNNRSIERTRSTFSVLLHACSCLSSLQLGRMIHAHIAKTSLESNIYVGTSLIDMYSKCGSISDAIKSFNAINYHNVATYTAMINGYSQHGYQNQAISLFNEMLERKYRPNSVTLVAVLSGFVHSGLIQEGLSLFYSMERLYRVNPSLEHYCCVVDLLGRAGFLDEAVEFVKQMPMKPDQVIYGALLKIAKNTEKKMLNLEHKHGSEYVVLSKMKKDPGLSWIEVNGEVSIFSSGDKFHLNSDLIYKTISHLTVNFEAS